MKLVTRQSVDRRRDRRRDPERAAASVASRSASRSMPEQLGVLAGPPDDVLGSPPSVDAEVAVGDPAVERRRLAVERPERRAQALQDVVQLAHRSDLPVAR